MAKRTLGVSGTAVMVGTAGLYLAYVGLKDIPFFDGLRSLVRQEPPTPRASHTPWNPALIQSAAVGLATAAATPGAADKGIDRLVGNAKNGYNVIRPLGTWQILGWGLRPDMSSDHPKGLAIDVMTKSEADAQRIITAFRGTPGAKYWIWNREIANVAVKNWTQRHYSGINPHTDHVHLSWS